MTIIPLRPYNTKSKAEYRVFNKLRETFVNDNNYMAFHSLNLTQHQTKRFGEADFVIICEYGIFVLEIKGGGISVENGQWYTVDKNSEQFRIQNPFKQAEGALHAIKREIESSNLFTYLDLSIGYGVIFPDIEWKQESSEWDLYTICDSRKFKNFEAWLKRFFNYWNGKPKNNKRLSIDDIQSLKQYLRPSFELLEPLDVKLFSTEEPYSYLNNFISNKKGLCSGGAGTGKTFLALELVKRVASDEKTVAFVCKSNWLKKYIEMQIKNEYVTVSSIESLKIDMRRSGIKTYDILIVDEGEDLFNFTDIELLDEVLNRGISTGEWYIFYDSNHQSNSKIEILKLLERYTPSKIKLNTNYRSSEQILNKIKETLDLDIGTKTTIVGSEVHELFDNKNSAKKLKLEIDNILKSGILAKNITILSPLPYQKSTISLLPQQMKKNIIQLDDYSIRYFPIDEISFSEIKNFKGFENEVIIVIDLIKPTNIKNNKIEYYIAMSRARGLLIVIWK